MLKSRTCGETIGEDTQREENWSEMCAKEELIA